MDNKINIEEIWMKHWEKLDDNKNHKLSDLAKSFALDFGNQLLELAAENAETKMASPDNYGHEPYNDSRIIVNKQSILDTIKQV